MILHQDLSVMAEMMEADAHDVSSLLVAANVPGDNNLWAVKAHIDQANMLLRSILKNGECDAS